MFFFYVLLADNCLTTINPHQNLSPQLEPQHLSATHLMSYLPPQVPPAPNSSVFLHNPNEMQQAMQAMIHSARKSEPFPGGIGPFFQSVPPT